MRLVELRVKGFRGFKDQVTVKIDPLTVLVGKNDSGKSSIIAALSAILPTDGIKALDDDDRCVDLPEGEPVEIICVFEEMPESLVLDATYPTTLKDECLLDENDRLVVGKRFRGKLSGKPEVFVLAYHPVHEKLQDLITLTQAKLKSRAKDLSVSAENGTVNASWRKAIRDAVADRRRELREIPLSDTEGKMIWEKILPHLPTLCVFAADRVNSDNDQEAQGPLKAAVRQALDAERSKLDEIETSVKRYARDVAEATIKKLHEFAPELASVLEPEFSTEPAWEKAFKLQILDERKIPLDKRGSGVRRLVLLSFFRAEAERKSDAESSSRSMIYVVEEPETALHPDKQRMVVDALRAVSEREDRQVVITTHVPGVASFLPTTSIRFVRNGASGTIVDSTVNGDALREIADELGVIPDKRVKVLVCVEGPHDISFLRRASKIFCDAGLSAPRFDNDPRVAIIPLGGSTLANWVADHYLRELQIPEVHIYDRDQSAQYSASVARVNSRVDGSCAVLTIKRELENYLHASAIEEVFGPSVAGIQIDDEIDVEDEVGRKLGKGKHERRSVKSWLNEDAVERMTVDRFRQRGALDEIQDWFNKVLALLERT